MSWRVWSCFASACALVIGCASSADPSGPAITTTPPPAADDDADSTTDGPFTTGINPPDHTTSTGEATTRGDDESDGSTDSGGRQESSGEDGSSSSGSNAETFPCDFPTTCNSAGTLGGVSGDTTVPSLTETGTEPIWLQIEVSENDSGIFGAAMSVTLDLDSMGGDWDIRAYLGDPGDANGCGGLEAESETTGADSVRFDWGEGAVANNEDDDAIVAVEIFPKADECTVGSSWSLTVTGND